MTPGSGIEWGKRTPLLAVRNLSYSVWGTSEYLHENFIRSFWVVCLTSSLQMNGIYNHQNSYNYCGSPPDSGLIIAFHIPIKGFKSNPTNPLSCKRFFWVLSEVLARISVFIFWKWHFSFWGSSLFSSIVPYHILFAISKRAITKYLLASASISFWVCVLGVSLIV